MTRCTCGLYAEIVHDHETRDGADFRCTCGAVTHLSNVRVGPDSGDAA